MRESILLKTKSMSHLVNHAVDGWSLRRTWINPPVGPPKILCGGKYKNRKSGIKLSLALIGRGGKCTLGLCIKEWIVGNGVQLRQ